MARRPYIRITDADKQLIRRVNQNVQAKKRRLKTVHGVDVDISTKTVDSFTTRDAFNAYVRDMKNFTDRRNTAYQYIKNKRGVSINKKVYNQTKWKEARINEQKRKKMNRLKNQAFKSGGAPTELTVGEQKGLMGDPRFKSLKELSFSINQFRSEREFMQFARDIEKRYQPSWIERKDELYKRNYMKGIETVFGQMGEELIDHIKHNVSPQELTDLYYTDKLGTIDFIYDYAHQQTKYNAIKRLFM